MNSESTITAADIQGFDAGFDAQRANRIAMNAVTKNGVYKSACGCDAVQKDTYEFSINLKQGDITNQKQSGRCWMFAALNVMRSHMIRTRGLKNFELSQSYLFFYDKLEKSNYFLENILETLDKPVTDRTVSFLLHDLISDGGQWDMLCSLVEKYGVVPKTAYPETASSSASREMNACLQEKLRGDACILRRKYAQNADMDALRAEKKRMMEDIYRILCICLGKPPRTFDFEYRDKDDHFFRECGLTPKSFYEKYIGLDLCDYVSIIHAPTQDKPLHRSYTVRFLGNVKEGRPVRYVNLPIETLKRVAIAQMRDGDPVWFGCDVGKRSDRDTGILDTALYDLESLFDSAFPMTRAQRLDYGESMMTHAMTFQGVNLDEAGKPNRWRVENSWGKDAGHDGYYVMSDAWFDEFVYQVVVDKKYLTADELAAYESAPIELEPWDPMGSLAL